MAARAARDFLSAYCRDGPASWFNGTRGGALAARGSRAGRSDGSGYGFPVPAACRSASGDLTLTCVLLVATRPENIVRVTWAPGDLVLFDNRSTQHYAPDDYGDLPRLLHWVTVAGDAPVGIDGTSSRALAGGDAGHYTPAVA